MDEEVKLLEYKPDKFSGVLIGIDLPTDPREFEIRLKKSLDKWKEEKKRGIWLRIKIADSHLIPIAVKAGFGFHHTSPSYLQLTMWLGAGPNKIPNYASHYIGIGGVVIREDTGEILVVQEKKGLSKEYNFWKVPGGQVEKGEFLTQACEREVLEETGIPTKFQQLLGVFRETKDYFFGCIDIYFLGLLKPLETEIKNGLDEVDKAKWMPLEEYLDFIEKLDGETFLFHKSMAKLLREKYLSKKQGSKEPLNLDVAMEFKEFLFNLGPYKKSQQMYITGNASHLEGKL